MTSWAEPEAVRLVREEQERQRKEQEQQQQQQQQQQVQPVSQPAPLHNRTDSMTSIGSVDGEWKEYKDPNTGRTYFANKVTGATQWERPQSLSVDHHHHQQQQQQQQQQQMRSPPATRPRPVSVVPSETQHANVHLEWDRVIDPKSGRPYYVHRATQKVQWEQPPGWTDHGSQASMQGHAAHHHHNHHQRTSSWDPASAAAANQLRQQNAPLSSVHEHSNTGGPAASSAASTANSQLQAKSRPKQHRSMPLPLQPSFHKLPQPIQLDIAKFQMKDFAQQHFRTVKRRSVLVKKVVPVEQIIQWQGKAISQCLLTSAKKQSSTACSNFKHILAFMGDAGKKRVQHNSLASKIVANGVKKPEMRDEIFCQLIKQTTHNPSRASVIMGWKLMAICAGMFAPSLSFQDFLLAHCAKNFDCEDAVKYLAPYSYWRIGKTIKYGGRDAPMRLAEVDAIVEKGQPSHEVSYGGSIDYIMMLQKREGIEDPVPRVLIKLTDMVMALNGHATRGIFRVAAERDETKWLQKQLSDGNYEAKIDSPHVVGDALKHWLRDLSEAVIPQKLYSQCLRVSNNPQAAIKLMHDQLPPSHFATLNYLICWLRELAKYKKATSMDEDNLAIVFSQDVLRSDEDDPQAMLHNSHKEQDFIANLIKHWPN
eukprot:TRINITY_DN66953_c8_g5_i1.p1 TRINITY_DN66953_c8_g5~~TRINITY_DN66953_c8_g5_i1.p1  ORF type:complete len:697 (-),score=334.80 TRINITY_DN66953_c8_g5_i1:64-2016(-)